MSTAVQQLDMFAAPPIAPPLPIARVHPHNPRALDVADCHRERHDCGSGIVVNVIVARCADGMYRGTAGYTSKTGGDRGPVFDSSFGSDCFHGARVLALLGLTARVRGASNAKILAAVESIPLTWWDRTK